MTIYVGDPNGLAKEVQRVHVGIDGVSTRVLKVYVGDSNNVARQVYEYTRAVITIPKMTSNTTPSGSCSASSVESSTTTAAWKAFDGDNDTYWSSNVQGSDGKRWVTYDFGYAVIPQQIYIYNDTSNTSKPAWRFSVLGSNDGSNFTTIIDCSASSYNTQTNRTFTRSDSEWIISAENAYRYFRYAATNISGTYRARLRTMQVYGYIPE
jgi:hypothetical protein